MNPALTLLTALLLAPLTGLVSAQTKAPAKPDPTFNATPAERAFGCTQIKLGGVMGHRIETMIQGNLYKLDMEGTYLSYFRKKEETGGVRSLGKTLDAAVHLAAYTGDPKLIAWKNHWIDELLSTQEPDGYIGIYRAGHRGTPTPTSLSYDNHEKGMLILALVNDYRFFGRTNSLQAAKKLAGEIMKHWTVLPDNNTLLTFAYPIILLCEASSDEGYAAWIRKQYLPDGKLTGLWRKQLGGNPLAPLNMEGLHVYSWCDAAISTMLLNRHCPELALPSVGSHLAAWLKDGGALAPGSFALEERWRRSQTTRSGMPPDPELCWANHHSRSKIGESCAKFYVVHLLDNLMKTQPDPYFGDVMERSYYNGIFGAQTPDGRSLAYDLSVEGTRIRNPRDHYCCPGNLRRAFGYLPKYFYYQKGDTVYVNLYSQSDAVLKLTDGSTLGLKQATDYPASGRIRIAIEVSRPAERGIAFRVPAWCRSPQVRVNNESAAGVVPGNFFVVRREWNTGDVVDLDFPMEWRWLRGIREQEGRAVLARGPIIYSLDPVASGITDYEDMRLDPNWGIQGTVKPSNTIPNFEQHMAGFRILENITLNPARVTEMKPDDRPIPFGSKVTIQGWAGSPQGQPDRSFVFREFANPSGRKIYLRLSDNSVCADDELFGTEIHEQTVYPARWATVKQGLDAAALAQISDAGLDQAVLVKPMRGSYEAETAQGELAGRPAWMSCSLAQTGKRRMEFRVQDKRFQNGATPEVTLSVLYLDKGDCKVSLIYDSGDDVARVRGRAPGAFKPGGEFQIGNTGTIKRHDFTLPDARFGKNLLLEGTDFRLIANKDTDFVIQGVFLQAANKNAPSVKSVVTTASAGNQQAAFGVESIKLGGVFGHRIDTMIKGNLLKIDVEKDFLVYHRKPVKAGFRATGLLLDAAVHLAAYSQQAELIRWKDHWIDELISTQDPAGYIGIILPGSSRGAVNFDLSEKGCILLALVNDYLFFGRQNSLEAARKLGNEFIASFNPAHFGKLWTCEYPLIALSEAAGDRKYVDWVRTNLFPQGKLSPMWTHGLGGWPWGFGGDPLKPLNMEGHHVYRWCDINVSMLYLNRHYPDPALRAGYPQMIAWIKDGGSLAPGSFALDERWRRSQTTRTGVGSDPEFVMGQVHHSKVGENCAKRYVVQLLHLAMKERPDPYYGDVMERTFYNGLFAGMSPTGRMLSYDLSVEGTRLANPADHFCCPGNLRRALAYLPGYFYYQQANQIYFNLYGESDARLKLPGGGAIRLVQTTDYPASGHILVTVETDRPVEQELLFRVPAWCRNPEIRLHGKALSGVQSGSFFPLKRQWKAGDVVELHFPTQWRWMRGIREQEGRAVLARGPIIYSLNPFSTGISSYVDLPVNVDDPWFADHQTASWGHPRVLKEGNKIPLYEEHMKGFRALEDITLDTSSVSGPEADANVPFGSNVTVKGWLGSPKGAPARTFVFNSFDHPNGRKIYLKLADRSSEVDDELFGKEIHEKTVYPARWAAVKKGLDATAMEKVPDAGLDQALLIKPMRGSWETETAQGQLAGRPAWMSASLAQTGKRRMEFRVQDRQFQNGACSNVTLSVLYLDKGDCNVSLIYDSGDAVVHLRGGKPGAFKPGGEFQIGDTGAIKRHDFALPDARFARSLRDEGTDFRLVANKDADFVILGAFLQAPVKPAPNSLNAPSVKSGSTPASAGAQQAAFGVDRIKLGGVFGHRIETMIKGNLLKLDMAESYLSKYRNKKGKAGAFVGIGFPLDAMVRFCAFTGDEELTRSKDRWMDGLIATQEPDGFIGTISPDEPRYGPKSVYAQVEMADTLLALVSDCQIFGRKKSLDAAVRLADCMVANWSAAPTPYNYIYDGELALMKLSDVSGDRKYLSWVKDKFLPPGGRLPEDWTKRLGGDPLKPLNLEGQHVYRWCDINLSMLYLNRHFPDPALRAGYPQMIAWIKDGGALAPGSFALNERWRRSQTARSALDHDPEFLWGQHERTKCGENCAKFYVVQLLHLAMEERPDPFYGDVMERTFYNGLFAGMSPTGRMLSYDLSVEGTKIANPLDYYCCPGNLRRALAYLPGYFYYQQANQIHFNLYGESDARLKLPGGGTIRLVQTTDYPASGKIRVTVETDRPVEQELLVRVPAWCRQPEIRLNGKRLSGVQSGSFFPLKRQWKAGDVVELDFPMEWRWMRGIREQEGRAVLARGPIIYSLNPFSSGISNYVDLPVNVDDPWFADHQTASWGHSKVLKKTNVIPGYTEHMKSFGILEDITLDPSSLSGPAVDDSVPFGSKVTVNGWLGSPNGLPNRTFVFNSFDHPNGRKIYLKLSDRSSEVDDELFGTEIHERTVYPARWETVKKGLNLNAMAQVPDAGLGQAVLLKPMRGSYEAETAQGELAGHPAWMSCSLANTGKRRMEFRVYDPKFQNGATPEVTLSVLYLDKGDCKVSLIYDSGDDVVRVRGRAPGAFKPGGEFTIGHTGAIKRHDFKLPDARFGKNLLLEGTDFRLVADKDVDFVILGTWLQAAAK